MAKAFNVAPGGTHIGLVRFSTSADVIFDFNKFTDQQSVVSAVEGTGYPGQGTLTGKGLSFTKANLFDSSARQGVNHILIVMTDGISADDVNNPSKSLRDSGVIVYSLGIGKNFNRDQLNAMATDPASDHVITADFSQLQSVVQRIKDQACKGI